MKKLILILIVVLGSLQVSADTPSDSGKYEVIGTLNDFLRFCPTELAKALSNDRLILGIDSVTQQKTIIESIKLGHEVSFPTPPQLEMTLVLTMTPRSLDNPDGGVAGAYEGHCELK